MKLLSQCELLSPYARFGFCCTCFKDKMGSISKYKKGSWHVPAADDASVPKGFSKGSHNPDHASFFVMYFDLASTWDDQSMYQI